MFYRVIVANSLKNFRSFSFEFIVVKIARVCAVFLWRHRIIMLKVLASPTFRDSARAVVVCVLEKMFRIDAAGAAFF